jgi:hypothetical protein
MTDPASLLWSKGYSLHCDFRGDDDYLLFDTESVQSEAFFARYYSDAYGLVWVRLSTLSRDRARCDLDQFVSVALPTIRRPFALITTDGDAGVPSELDAKTVAALLNSPWLVSWHTQNYDGFAHPKLSPIPLGLDLHTRSSRRGAHHLATMYQRCRNGRQPLDQRPLRVFCDFNVSISSRDRQQAIAEIWKSDHVDLLNKRLPQKAIWQRYAQYPFVLSARGNGIDCHRTWEILYLGSIVITKRSSLDQLYKDLPVALVDDWNEVLEKPRLAIWLEQFAGLADRERINARLTPEHYIHPIRTALKAACSGQAPTG